MIYRLAGALLSRAKEKYLLFKYSKFETGHIFDIKVGDMAFAMTFMDYRLGRAIIERIEGRREPKTTAIIESLVTNGSKVLELGGCYGYFTIIMSKCAGPNGKVVSIEGTPNNYEILTENIRINNIRNVEAYNFFITSKSSETHFGLEDKHPYNAIERLETQGESTLGENWVSVPAIRLSEFLEDINLSPDYIFMDIEGFEVEVFEDFSDGYLRSNRPVIVFEVHRLFYKGTKDLSFIKGVLEQNKYYFRRVAGNLVCFPVS